MGEILSSKVLPDNQLKLKVCLDEKEALTLEGSVKDIHIFCRDLCTAESKVIEKGKGGVAKYFLIPATYRSRSKKVFRNIQCQKIETNTNAMFVYVIDKKKDILW